MATIAAVHDLSGLGRCSLTTALAILPAMGHTCYPLPTAVLSQQTAFAEHTFLDLTGQLEQHLTAWEHTGVQLDMLYSGFLGGGKQAELICGYIDAHPEMTVLIDPVMGDGGQLYSCYDAAYVQDMRRLAKSACVLVPNMTEMMLLAGESADTPLQQEEQALLALGKAIGSARLQSIVVTSAVYAGAACNLLIDISGGRVEAFPVQHNGISYSGTGDLFASLLCGWLADGVPIREAIPAAAEFVAQAVSLTPNDADPRWGLRYEPLLYRLTRGKIKKGCEQYA